MKKFLLLAVAAILAVAMFPTDCAAQKKSRKELKAEAKAAADSVAALEASLKEGVAEMTFKYTDHNFGTMEQGSDVSFNFEFVNTGKNDLIINNVATSCGCTTPEWTHQPVPSKTRGSIKVKYDSNRIGNFSKTITVYSNATNSPVVLTIRGNITVKQN
ncbi:MAG: DUF1573 domain-containing protein [Bacteroidales bacterium]|nr:DUF1573 domain-containing protein [Bacteroidales bacterium]